MPAEMTTLTRKIINGVAYADYKSKISPLDIVLFRGGDLVSSTIRFIERQRTGSGDFSHAGIIVTSDVLSHPDMKPGKLYILESTVTGVLGCGVKNIEGKSEFCVQITDFDKLVEKYDNSEETAIAVFHVSPSGGCLSNNGIRARLQPFWHRVRGCSYQFNLYSLLSAAFPFLRGARKQAEKLFRGENWLFCSQLVCMTLQEVGYLPAHIDSKTVLPVDFLGCDEDKQVPCIVSNAHNPVYLLNKKWAKKKARFPTTAM